uniref:Integrin beta-3 n=1 Tax=Salmo salar TaxID=8030 RepID=B5XEH9_SALSA|nr:Integrin beta-3 precursor [Salmo salar]
MGTFFDRLWIFSGLLLASSEVLGSNICTSRGVSTCRQCLAVHPSCAWCFKEEFGQGGSSVSRCDLKQNLLDGGCTEEGLEFPFSTLSVQKDTPLSDKASGAADDVTQIRPQKLRLTLRPAACYYCHGLLVL